MKAPAPPVLPEEVPPWVPGRVRDQVLDWQKRYAHDYREHPDDLVMLRRLLIDPRMEQVWKTLNGKSPAKLKRFFFFAYDAACHRRSVTPLKVAKRIDGVAQAMRGARARRGDKFMAPPLALKPDGWQPPNFVFSKHQESDAVRAYVLELSGLTSELFGEISYRTVATTTSVALRRRVTWRQVRKWTDRPSIALY